MTGTLLTAMLVAIATIAIVIALIALYCSLLDSIYKERLTADEVYMVTTGDLWKIRVCRYRRGRTNGQPVLLVHGANVNQHNWTSPRGASLVDHLVDRGYDCWTVDLRGCRSSEAPFERHRNQITTDDYLNDDIPTMIRFVQQETGYAKIHYCGHSMGGMLLYAYVLKYGGDSIASAVTLASPPGFEGVKASRSRFLVRLLRIYPPLFGSIVRAATPIVVALKIKTPLFPINMRNLAKGLGPEYFYNMLEDPLPGVLDDLAKWVSTPGWKMDGGALDVQAGLESLDIPLFAIFAPLDPFIPLDRAQKFVDGMASTDKRIRICSKEQGCKQDYNHCELAFSREGGREVFLPIARWFETHTTRDRMPIAEPDVATGYQTPLNASQRAEILSGDSFAHLPTEPPLERETVEEELAEHGVQLRPVAPKRPTGKKKSATQRKSAAKGTEKAAPKRKPAAKGAPANKGKQSGESATPKGPDLAAVSAALTALRPQHARPSRPVDPLGEGPITVTPDQSGKRAPKTDDAVETPASVLKALSNASSAMQTFKQPEEKNDPPSEPEKEPEA